MTTLSSSPFPLVPGQLGIFRAPGFRVNPTRRNQQNRRNLVLSVVRTSAWRFDGGLTPPGETSKTSETSPQAWSTLGLTL
jgi:hypothetical protein